MLKRESPKHGNKTPILILWVRGGAQDPEFLPGSQVLPRCCFRDDNLSDKLFAVLSMVVATSHIWPVRMELI